MSEFDQDTQEQGQSVKFDINSVINNAKSVITTPSNYFQNMSKSGGLLEPMIFIIVMAVVTGVLAAVFSLPHSVAWPRPWLFTRSPPRFRSCRMLAVLQPWPGLV